MKILFFQLWRKLEWFLFSTKDDLLYCRLSCFARLFTHLFSMKQYLFTLVLFIISLVFCHSSFKDSVSYTDATYEITNDNLRDLWNRIEESHTRINEWYRQIIRTQMNSIEWVYDALSLFYKEFVDIEPEYRGMDNANWFYFAIWYNVCVKIQPYTKVITTQVECPIDYNNYKKHYE